MKFPYISLDTIVAEAASELKRINRQGNFNEDDAYSYAVEAIRLIGGFNLNEDTVVITIKNHVGAMPRNFYTANTVWQASEVVGDVLSMDDTFRLNGYIWAYGDLMYPGDTSTIKHFKDKGRNPKQGFLESFVFKIPPGLIRTSFGHGHVGMNYNYLPMDDNGIMQCQDEPNTIKAIKSYITMMILKEPFLSGQVPKYVYDNISAEYDQYFAMAISIQAAPDPSHIGALKQEIDNRYKGFNLRTY